MYNVVASPSAVTTVGATPFPDKSGASFRVWAPNAAAVSLRITPQDGQPWQIFALGPATDDPHYWSLDLGGAAAGHLYQYEITNRGGDQYDPGGLPLLRVDPCAREVVSSDRRKPGLIVDPAQYRWASPFRTPDFKDFIIYQAHVGSLAGRGDGMNVYTDANGGTARFDQIEAKLDYIRSLNFNAVQFLPTGEYRGTEGEAYNPSNYYAPEVLYGNPDDLRHLVDACHQRGLAVLLDVVYNHMDGADNLWQFDGNNDNRTDESNPQTGGGIYFSRVETGFGRRPNHDAPEVQQFFIKNSTLWLEEYHADGLRFDSAANFSQGGLQTIVAAVRNAFPDKFIYAEDSDPGYIFNTIGFAACWDMGSPDNFARIVGNRDVQGLQNLIGRFGYPTAYSAIKYLLGSHDQIFNEWKYLDQARTWGWDKPGGGGLRENRYFVERIGGAVDGRQNWFARAQARLGWALNVAIPCTPLLFMGSECHHYGYWNPELDPFGDHRFDWSIAGDPIGQPMREMVRDVNAVRWDNPALRTDTGPLITHLDPANRVLAFKRWNEGGNVLLVVVNISDNQWDDPVYQVAVGAPDGGSAGERWTEIFNSQAPQYGGWADSGNYLADVTVSADGRFAIRLPKWSVLIFKQV